MLFELRPASLEAHGLAEAVRKHVDVLARVDGVPVAVACEGGERLDPNVEQALFRIVQEALATPFGPRAVREWRCPSTSRRTNWSSFATTAWASTS